MFESDADRLAMIRALGGVVISTSYGTCDALFENAYVGVGDMPVESTSPQLTVRSSDVDKFRLAAGLEVTVDGEAYIIRSVQPDGTGMTILGIEAP
jgi:hypothetical protein